MEQLSRALSQSMSDVFYLPPEHREGKCLGCNMDQEEDYQEIGMMDRKSRGVMFVLIMSSQDILFKIQPPEIIWILAKNNECFISFFSQDMPESVTLIFNGK